jgi:TRAP-type transport system periplasmic protein
MKRLFVAAFVAAGMSHAFCFAQGPAQSAQTWKLATGYRAESFHGRNLAEFAQEIERATQGQLKIELHPNNSLVKLADMRAAVQEARVQAGESIMSGLVKDMPVAGADSVPFVVSTYADARRLWDLQKPHMERAMAEQGLKALYAVPWPPQGLYSKKPIASAQDFKGTSMRTYNATTQRIAELLGAKGVDVPMVDVGKALKEGRIDSMITSAVTGVENKVWGDIKHYYELNAWFPKNIIYVNAKAFAALPKSSQDAVMQAATSAEQRGWRMSEEAASASVQELRNNGVKIDRIPRELEVTIRRLGERFSREWVASVGHDASAIFTPYYFSNTQVAATRTNPQVAPAQPAAK